MNAPTKTASKMSAPQAKEPAASSTQAVKRNTPMYNDVMRQLGSVDLEEFGLTLDDITSDVSINTAGGTRTLNVVLSLPAEYLKNLSKDKIRELQSKADASLRALGGDMQVAVVLSTHSNVATQEMKPDTPKVKPQVKQSVQKPKGIKKVLAVASGKGGVGKSLVAVNLALALAYHHGLKVGVLDADIYGPSVPQMMGMNGQREMTEGGLVKPQEKFGISTMSMGYMLEDGQPAIWRGPMINKALHHMSHDVAWNGLDVLVLDTPPGTGDVPLSLNSILGIDGAVIVSTPQKLALDDARRGIGLFQKMEVPIFGVVENMSEPKLILSPDEDPSHAPLPKLVTEPNFFGEGGVEAEAHNQGIDFLGKVPFDYQWTKSSDDGKPIVAMDPEGAKAQPFKNMAKMIAPRLVL